MSILTCRCAIRPGRGKYGLCLPGVRFRDKEKRASGRIRASPTFRLGLLFTRSAQRPEASWLPLSVLWLLITVVRERLGQIPRFSDLEDFDFETEKRESIVVFLQMGLVSGHFTRVLAISRRLKKINPNLEIIFFTTMPTLHILQEEGFVAYHLPGGRSSEIWALPHGTKSLKKCFQMCLPFIGRKHLSSMELILTGGMLNAIKTRGDMLRIWVRRRNFKKGGSSLPVDSFSHFDLLINLEIVSKRMQMKK